MSIYLGFTEQDKYNIAVQYRNYYQEFLNTNTDGRVKAWTKFQWFNNLVQEMNQKWTKDLYSNRVTNISNFEEARAQYTKYLTRTQSEAWEILKEMGSNAKLLPTDFRQKIYFLPDDAKIMSSAELK